jgi:hypothetical protein
MLFPGSSAIEVVIHLLEIHQGIRGIRLVQYKRHTKLTPACPCCGSALPPSAPASRLQHGTANRKFLNLSRHQVTQQYLSRLLDGLPHGEALAVTSRLRLHGSQIGHIPMVDFRCSHAASDRLVDYLQQLHPEGGFLLKTTNSYHFYGNTLLTHSKWRRFAGRCLLGEPDVDVRWLGHRLIEGWSSLRISPDSHLHPVPIEPILITLLQPSS